MFDLTWSTNFYRFIDSNISNFCYEMQLKYFENQIYISVYVMMIKFMTKINLHIFIHLSKVDGKLNIKTLT